jgi:methionine synthase II (cobalamin-independent)
MPGTDMTEALAVVLGELPDLPHLPELPARGPGADMVGRGAGLLVELPVDLQPSGWRFVDRPGLDARRTRDLLERDLDALTEAADGYTGPLKLQAPGPWTLAATVELARGDKALSDRGAVRDLTSSLAEGLAVHAAEVGARVPGAEVVLQVDEPSLPAVLAGRVRTASGFGTLAAVEAATAEAALREVVDRLGVPVVVHCCAQDVPVTLLAGAGVTAVGLDMALLDLDDPDVLDPLGTALEGGLRLVTGVVPATDATLSDPAGTVRRVRTLWRRLGLDPAALAGQVAVAPACGMAGASPAYVRSALARCREAGRVLVDDPEG